MTPALMAAVLGALVDPPRDSAALKNRIDQYLHTNFKDSTLALQAIERQIAAYVHAPRFQRRRGGRPRARDKDEQQEKPLGKGASTKAMVQDAYQKICQRYAGHMLSQAEAIRHVIEHIRCVHGRTVGVTTVHRYLPPAQHGTKAKP